MKAARRHLRWFVALHLGAVALLYAAAHVIGGGWSQVLPPDLHGAAAPAVPAARSEPTMALTAASALTTADLPAWAYRTELSRPGEGQ